MSTASSRLPIEFAHILFMDIVRYTQQSMNRMAAQIATLRHLVETAPEYQRAASTDALICLDTGDGMALVFFRDPVAPLQCALEIARALQKHPDIPLRMGIHAGPVLRSHDLSGKQNVTGDGINFAQRVMSCGDAGHILLSRNSTEALRGMEEWTGHLHDLGEFTVKHGERLHLFHYYDGSIGNPAPPASRQILPPDQKAEVMDEGREPAQSPTPQPPTPPTPSSPTPDTRHVAPVLAPTARSRPTPAAVSPLKIALLYKRNAQPDIRLLGLLEADLNARGHQVFIDRHLSVGVEWAQAIEREIRSADAVITLLSAASVHSDMLAYEIETAHKAAQERGGKPRLLPIRVAYAGPLPDELAPLLDPLQYLLWETPQDDTRLMEEITRSLESPPPPRPPEALEPIGGAVPLDSKFYIAREADAAFKTAIGRRDSIVLVKGARQMGKTSLLARGLQQAREAGARVAVTDFQNLEGSEFQSGETFFLALARLLKVRLKLEVSLKSVWDEDLSPSMNLDEFVCHTVLETSPEPLVWGLDEVDRLFTCPFGSDVFALFRSWHNRRATEPSGPWSRLTLVIAYATEAHLFIRDVNQSPFNVGTRLTLDDFTLDQVTELNARYGEPLRNPDERARFYRLLNGQPYLVRRGLDLLASQTQTLDTLEAQADRDEGPFGDHLRRILVLLSQDTPLLETVRGLLRAQTLPDEESFYRLRSAGLFLGDAPSQMRPRCQLYAAYLSRHLL